MPVSDFKRGVKTEQVFNEQSWGLRVDLKDQYETLLPPPVRKRHHNPPWVGCFLIKKHLSSNVSWLNKARVVFTSLPFEVHF